MVSHLPQHLNQSGLKTQSVEVSLLLANLKKIIWFLGIPAWSFGMLDRSLAFLSAGYFSAISFLHLCIISLFFVGWLYLQPASLYRSDLDTLESYRRDANPLHQEVFLCRIERRMLELSQHHLISQEYNLPFPYLCQIYHLLNLKHLESVHQLSLNNLKVMNVSTFQPTQVGGIIKFQTILESPFNVLRLWRQPRVEAQLVLHTPYTVELNIPVYNQKTITVLFNVQPLSAVEHKLFIDIYSTLEGPKPILQWLMHVAAGLTLFEDLPYLRKLSQKQADGLANLDRISTHETLHLYRRFVDLYGHQLQPAEAES